jgi:hypothetical protein
MATGTLCGVGLFRKPPVFLKSGDLMEVEWSRSFLIADPLYPLCFDHLDNLGAQSSLISDSAPAVSTNSRNAAEKPSYEGSVRRCARWRTDARVCAPGKSFDKFCTEIRPGPPS